MKNEVKAILAVSAISASILGVISYVFWKNHKRDKAWIDFLMEEYTSEDDEMAENYL